MFEKPNLFDLFGGVREMARLLDEAPSTVQGWKSAERIPAQRQPAVLAKAHELGLPVTAEDIIFPMGRPEALQPDAPSAGQGAEADSPAPFSDREGAMAASSPTCSRTNGPLPSPVGSLTSSSSSEPKAA